MRKNFESYAGQVFLKRDWVFPYSEVPRGASIILYGAGDVGQAYYEQIAKTKYCKINKWVDQCFQELRDIGFPVEKPETIHNIEIDYVVIAVADLVTAREINKEVISGGIPQEKIVWIGNERRTLKTAVKGRLLEPIQVRINNILKRRNIDDKSSEAGRLYKEIERMMVNENKLILPRVVVEMSPVCTLHCTKCNNLMPFYHHPIHRPVEEVLGDINIFMNSIDILITMELIGGEPFAYPYLLEVLKFVLEKENIMEVEITTNGTIIPSEEILKELRHSKIIVKISDYGIAGKSEELIDIFVKSSIRYEIDKNLKWVDSGNIEKRERTIDELKNVYASCTSSYYCKTLYKRKLFACARSASLHDLGICNDLDGYIDMNESEDLKERIRGFFLKQFDLCCDYCDSSETWRYIPAGEQN